MRFNRLYLVCKSGEGIKLLGEVTVRYTKIKIFVDEKEIYAASTNGKEIEKYLLPEKHLNEINKFRVIGHHHEQVIHIQRIVIIENVYIVARKIV